MRHGLLLLVILPLLGGCGYTMGLGPDACPAPTPAEAAITKSVWH